MKHYAFETKRPFTWRLSNAFKRGVKDRNMGIPLLGNPFSVMHSHREHEAWETGWIAQGKELGDTTTIAHFEHIAMYFWHKGMSAHTRRDRTYHLDWYVWYKDQSDDETV